MSKQQTLLFVGAHPDDETFGIGGTLAQYAAAGVNLYYACATRGEAGIADPEHMTGHATPGDMRWAELKCASRTLGIADVIYLGYRDSGMPGSEDNKHPEALAAAPLEEVVGRVVVEGGALAYYGGNYIYAFQGDETNKFWRYDIGANSWTSRANAPGLVREGGALAYYGSNYIYAFQGNETNSFWRYDIGANSWTSMANALGNVKYGGSIAAVRESATYSSPGTIASQVRDTGVASARWDALFWDETLQSNTDITFEVRAANNLAGGFPDASWINLGSANSPITSGLPSGQYMQWRATLTTSDTSKTPTLREVRVYHY